MQRFKRWDFTLHAANRNVNILPAALSQSLSSSGCTNTGTSSASNPEVSTSTRTSSPSVATATEGLGLSPSLNWGDGIAVAEPVHGSAPDIAGQGIANPIASILSAAMLARYVWAREEAADRVETAVSHTLTNHPNLKTTQAITDAILKEV